MKNILTIFLLLATHAFSQSVDDSTDQDMFLRQPVEQFFEDHAETLQGQKLLEDLSERIEEPIDINTATKEELLAIPGMSPLTVDKIMKKRAEYHGFRALSEIRDIEGLDPRTLSSLRIFTAIATAGHQPSLWLRTRYYYDFQPSKGQTTGAYEGSQLKASHRVKWKFGDRIETSFAIEKDAGEKSWTDFVSGYLRISAVGYISSVVAGDFLVENGNGIAFGSYSSFGKGTEEMSSVPQVARGVIPYRSNGESRFFRGIGANLQAGSFNGFLFLSRKELDATLNDSGSISSLYDLGYHRTQTEKEKRAAAKVDIVGARWCWTVIPNYSVGFLWYGARFDPAFGRADPVDRYKPSGNTFSSCALDYQAAFPLGTHREVVQLSGEWMRDQAGTIGGATVVKLHVRGFQCDLGYRFYPEKLISLFGSGFGEHGTTLQNESGVYMGFRADISRDIRASVYSDYYRFPWPTYRNPLPTTGRNIQIDVDMDVIKSLKTRIRYRFDVREEKSPRQRQIFRADVDMSPWKGVGFRTRIELVRVNESTVENGLLIYANIRANIIRQARIEGRIDFFRTDSYTSALYAYESDVGGAFTVPLLYGKGIRWYIMASYSIEKKVALCLKYSELRKNDVESLGSGYDAIEGGVDNSIHLQLDLAF